MAKIEGKCREVLDKTEWVGIATTGAGGPHLAGTWGESIRALGVKDDEIILVPAGGLLKTEQNLEKDNRIEILCATRQVQGGNGPGKGCKIRGTGQLKTAGELTERVKKKFPWARGVLVIKAEEVIEQL
jgi:hypothetical protein